MSQCHDCVRARIVLVLMAIVCCCCCALAYMKGSLDGYASEQRIRKELRAEEEVRKEKARARWPKE